MGTRADFYVGRGESAEWLGSIAWDGYPEGIDNAVLSPMDERDYRVEVNAFLFREDGTLPKDGWPWPWNDSQTTDYAYAFEDGSVFASNYGHKWFKVDINAETYGQDDDDESDKSAVFPDMSSRKNVQFGGPRSGLIVVTPDGAS